MTLEDGPNREALEVLRRELSDDGRGALGHLLRNALTTLVVEVNFPPAERDEDALRESVDALRELVDAMIR